MAKINLIQPYLRSLYLIKYRVFCFGVYSKRYLVLNEIEDDEKKYGMFNQ